MRKRPTRIRNTDPKGRVLPLIDGIYLECDCGGQEFTVMRGNMEVNWSLVCPKCKRRYILMDVQGLN